MEGCSMNVTNLTIVDLNQYQVITAKAQGYLVSVKHKPITFMFEAIVSGNKFYYRLDFIQRKH